MVNFRRIICDIVLVLLLSAPALAAPHHDPNCRREDHHVGHYDQSQNGTENYRVNIDGVVIAVAPAESFLAAASNIDWEQLLELQDIDDADLLLKPPAASQPSGGEPASADEKPSGKPDNADSVESASPASNLTINSTKKGHENASSEHLGTIAEEISP